MNVDFLLILVYLVGGLGVVVFFDQIFFAKERKQSGRQPSLFIEYARSFFPILLAVLVIRSFVVQPFRVPTGSLEPTVLPGDFIAVSQYTYGLRLPVLHRKVVEIGNPKRGDIAVFRWPRNEKITFVKRVIGVPGDHIQYINKVLFVNGVEAKQEVIGPAIDEENAYTIQVEERREQLNGIKHRIFVRPDRRDNNVDIYVPAGHYFMMGDNRDNSDDSRDWGFVPDENLIGKAFGIWLSWDSHKHWFRWNRMGTSLIANGIDSAERANDSSI